MPTYDLCIVSGRRPDLIERTLASFQEQVFRHFALRRVLVNIDPFCGTEQDGDEVARIVTRFFPAAELFRPEQASFGAAVRRLWQATSADIVLHLEDDWIALEPITPADVEGRLAGRVAALTLMTAEKHWSGGSPYQTRRKKYRIAGVPVWSRRVSRFSTSPCFLSGPFARTCAGMMDARLDPEKQFYDAVNAPLERFSEGWDALFLVGKRAPNVIEDIGRDWREQRSISKTVVNGVSIWRGVHG
jgi:hypothetical protein